MMQSFYLGCILFAAAYQDLRERRISNCLFISGMIGTCIFRYVYEAERGILQMTTAFIVTLFVFFPLFAIHAIGAGDVKLFSLVPSMHGLAVGIQVCVLWLVLAGIVSFWKLITGHRLHQRLAYAWCYFITAWQGKIAGRTTRVPYYDRERDGTKDTIPLVPFLTAAYGIVHIGRWKGVW